MKQSIILKSGIELLIAVLGFLIAYAILLPITNFVEYTASYQITVVTIILCLSIYWIFYFDRSVLLQSIWVRSIFFIAIIIGLLTLTSQFVAFSDVIDSFDISLFGPKKMTLAVSKESDLLNYIYRSHLLLYSSTIMSLVVFEFKLLKSILTFIARMR